MYDNAARRRALELHRSGLTISAISREVGANRSTIRAWFARPVLETTRRSCFVCTSEPCPNPAEYCYLLGQYLGDGYLVTSIRVPRMRIACADAYPQIAAAVDHAMATLSGNRVSAGQRVGCTDRGANWMHWPCLFPQAGPGRKHERKIELAPWQEALVTENPWAFLRGLIHSDGCRALNRVWVRGKLYEYPRYFFSNESTDILTIAGRTLDRVGVAWRYSRPNCISVARRASVALMDEHIGPKS